MKFNNKLSKIIFILTLFGITSFTTPDPKPWIAVCRIIEPINNQGSKCSSYENHIGFKYASGSSLEDAKAKLISYAGNNEPGLRSRKIMKGYHLHVLKVKNTNAYCTTGCSRIEYYFGIGDTQADAKEEAEKDFQSHQCPGKSNIIERWEKGF